LASAVIAAPKPHIRLTERETVERWLVNVRLDPKSGAVPGECDDLSVADLAITVEGVAARPTTVERVPRPERHWLLVDISTSAEARRAEAKRSAAQYVREVMMPGIDSAAVLTVDQDTILVVGPSSDPSELAHAIEGVPAGWTSALRDGLDVVLRQIQGDRHENLVLYWTDGEDTSSVITSGDLYASLVGAPNATIFPIALLPKGGRTPAMPLTGKTLTEAARISGGEVFVSSDPRWLDRVRGWIGRRFTVGFAPPPEWSPAGPSRRGLKIEVPQKRCDVTVLADRFAGSESGAVAAPPAPPSLVRLRHDSESADDPPCATTTTGAPWESPLRTEREGLSGCILDCVRSPGPYVVEARGAWTYSDQLARVVSRNIRVLAPDLSRLPTDLAEVIDAVTPGDPGAPAPFLMEGNALLGQRTRIATSLFAARADYHDFALQRLRRFAVDDLHEIERDLSHDFPNLPAEQIAAAARASLAGRRAIEAAHSPTDADIARVLGAWIRDIPAAEMLQDLEKRFIDTRIRDGTNAHLEEQWTTIRERFAVPSRTRIVAPLALMRDPWQDLVGFVRVVLPRPEWFYRPEFPHRSDPVRVDPRLPRRPLALLLVEALARKPGVGEAFAALGYHAVALSYEPKEQLMRSDPGRPYARARVVLTLEATSGEPAARVELDAKLDGGFRGDVTILDFKPIVTGDPVLAALLAN
jgi:hypothetical protein